MIKRIRLYRVFLSLAMSMALLFAFVQPAFAAAETVDVVTQERGEFWGETYVYKYTYNSKGLLTQRISYISGEKYMDVRYKYNSDKLVSKAVVYEYGKKVLVVSYNYNSKKHLRRRVSKRVDDPDSSVRVDYSYSKGLLSKSVERYTGNTGLSDGATVTMNYTYNAKGVLSEVHETYSYDKEYPAVSKYTFNAKGFATKYTWNDERESYRLKRTPVYNKKGKLKQYSEIDNTETLTYTVTTKEISVPKAAAGIVRKQQQEIINAGYNGTDLLLGYDLF